ncbi:MAG: protein translocase subunit SecD [Pseudomonadota bacterium]|nr:protein translocase subunit SecD [Pseudomonadota bacterium]
MLLRFAWGHYSLIIVAFAISLLYSVPNLYPDKPAISLSIPSDPVVRKPVLKVLESPDFLNFKPNCYSSESDNMYCAFSTVDEQMQAKSWLDKTLPFSVHASLALVESTPKWMQNLGLKPMKLGLDLRGGVHLLVQVDTHQALSNTKDIPEREVLLHLRKQGIPYRGVNRSNNMFTLSFINDTVLDQASKSLETGFSALQIERTDNSLLLSPKLSSVQQKSEYILNKTLESIERRVNELGLSEAVVQKQGEGQISIDLPGIQDIEHAKSILGNTASLSFQFVANNVDINEAKSTGLRNYEVLYTDSGAPLVVYRDSVLAGDSITYATASSQEGKPVVQIQLGGGGEESFYQATKSHVGDQLAIILLSNEIDEQSGERAQTKRIISAPVIQQPLRQAFVISGMRSYAETETLSLLLRSGSLAAPVDIVQEMTIGPSLGAENIQKGIFSIVVGFALIMLFMVTYYRYFGVIANIALLLNLLSIVCLLSWLSATLTLPAMAAIVLTVGMAVDANVLINERIREELRLGASAKDALTSGYEKAFATIFDANITTLIVSLVLFTLSSGMIKGFAVTLIIGIAASMFTSVYVTRIISWSIFPYMRNLHYAIGI